MSKNQLLIVSAVLVSMSLTACGTAEDPGSIGGIDKGRTESTQSQSPDATSKTVSPTPNQSDNTGDCKTGKELSDSHKKMRDILLKTQSSAKTALMKSPSAAFEELVIPYYNHDLSAMKFITAFGLGAKLNPCPVEVDKDSASFEVLDEKGQRLLLIHGRYDFDRVYILDGGVHIEPEYENFQSVHLEESLKWPS